MNKHKDTFIQLDLPADFVEKYDYASKSPTRWNIKRMIDITHSLAGLILLLPVMLATAIVIKIESDGPIIFKQTRIGLKGKLFTIYKFRTMYNHANLTSVKNKNDYRITKTGKFLRKYSIDETPQLFNVLKGDMSIIGPRPQREQVFNKIQSLEPEYKLRFTVKPGLRLVEGKASANMAYIEREYIENWSLLNDFKIFLKLVKDVTNGKNY